MTSHRAGAPFRRRCGWCARPLRWWQPNRCRDCSAHIEDPGATSPCPEASQWDAAPDRAPWSTQR